MTRNRATRFLTSKMLIITGVVCALIIAAATGASTSGASPRSAFCSPHRTLQSFDGDPAHGFLAHLAVAPGQVRPGSYPAFRIVNEGSDELAEQAGWIQRWTGGSWIRMPEGPNPIFGAVAFVRPHSVSGCVGPLTGHRWKPGKYRFLLEVEAIEKSREPTQPEKHWLHAAFLLGELDGDRSLSPASQQ